MRIVIFRLVVIGLLFIIGVLEIVNIKVIRDTPNIQTIVIIENDTIPSFMSGTAEEYLMEALIYYNVEHPDIVYAQAILETGNFKSKTFLNNNNLFGLYNSKNHRYYSYNHWSESIIAYIKYIQSKYDSSGNYYKFLQDIRYAEDPDYISKVKEIVKQNDKRRSK